MANTADPQRFGRIVRLRREELGLQQTDLRDRGGPSSTTMSLIERGLQKDVTPLVLRKLDTGLGWIQGSAARALRGGEPTANDLATQLRPGATRPTLDEGHVLTVIERMLDRGGFPEEDREQLRYELEELKIDRFPSLFDGLSRAGKVRVVKFGEQVRTEEQLQEDADAVHQTPPSGAQTQGDQDQEVLVVNDPKKRSGLAGQLGSKPIRRAKDSRVNRAEQG